MGGGEVRLLVDPGAGRAGAPVAVADWGGEHSVPNVGEQFEGDVAFASPIEVVEAVCVVER